MRKTFWLENFKVQIYMDKHDQITDDNLKRTCSTHGGGPNGFFTIRKIKL